MCVTVFTGTIEYVLDAERPFLVNLTHGARTEDLDDPLRTVTGANRGEKALVTPSLVSIAHGDSGGRREYPLTDPYGVVTAGGVAHALVAPSIAKFNTGATGSSIKAPLPTVTANSYLKRPGGAAPLGLLAPVLTYAQQGGRCRSIEDPHHTICASKKDQNSMIAATMVHVGNAARTSSPRTSASRSAMTRSRNHSAPGETTWASGRRSTRCTA